MNGMHEGHRQRLRERYLVSGLATFADHEILELILTYAIPQKDVNPLAHELLTHFGSLEKVFSAEPSELAQVKGIGNATAILLNMFAGVSKRIRMQRRGARPLLNSNEAAGSYCCELIGQSKTEVFYAVALDASERLLHCCCIAEGSVKETIVPPRKIVDFALRSGAAYILLAHNHPAGTLLPSASDLELTRRIRELLGALDIALGEHFIVCGEQFYAIGAGRMFDVNPTARLREQPLPTDPDLLVEAVLALGNEDLSRMLNRLDELQGHGRGESEE